jgi:hypothetical protein
MNTWKRIIIGILCYFFALCLLLLDLDNDSRYLGGLFTIAGTLALRREWVKISTVFWRVANRRAAKVAKDRRCELCSGPPCYMLRLVAIDPAIPSPCAGMELHVCAEHHPNKLIAPRADELDQLIKSIDKNLTYNCVYYRVYYEM